MHTVVRKMTKVIDELVAFFMGIGSTGIRMDLKKMDDGYVLTLRSDFDPVHQDRVEELKRAFLEADRSEGIEEVYWELAGVNAMGEDSEIYLIGQMVKVLSVEIMENQVELAVYKKKART